MPSTDPVIDHQLVHQLLAQQFPQWASLPLAEVATPGWCNRAFRLGDELLVRLPRHEAYAAQVEKEQQWLPLLAPHLPLPIPAPVGLGRPQGRYPWHWSVYRWLPGDTARPERVSDMLGLASDLGRFLQALQRIDAAGGPPPSDHNFHRGGELAVYDAQTREAIGLLQGRIDTAAATRMWEAALATSWTRPPVWLHGDVSVGNLLVREGRLVAVIDFGNAAVGDPACDLAPAWTVFDRHARAALREALPLDEATWLRGRAWVLWKALILVSGLSSNNTYEATRAEHIIGEVLDDHRDSA